MKIIDVWNLCKIPQPITCFGCLREVPEHCYFRLNPFCKKCFSVFMQQTTVADVFFSLYWIEEKFVDLTNGRKIVRAEIVMISRDREMIVTAANKMDKQAKNTEKKFKIYYVGEVQVSETDDEFEIDSVSLPFVKFFIKKCGARAYGAKTLKKAPDGA